MEMLTIRQAADRGPLTEYTLRLMAKQGKLPCIYAGNRCLINYDRLLTMLDGLGEEKLVHHQNTTALMQNDGGNTTLPHGLYQERKKP